MDPDDELAQVVAEVDEVAVARQEARVLAAFYTQCVAEGIPHDMAEEMTDAYMAFRLAAESDDE